MFFVYFAKSHKNDKVYVGFTTKEPGKRVFEHNTGSNKWTRQNKPLKLIYYERIVCEEDARLREKSFKTGIGKKLKIAIVKAIETTA